MAPPTPSLLAKVRDGATYSVDGIRDGSVDFAAVADVVAAVQPARARRPATAPRT